MSQSIQELKWAENEVVFRQSNESITEQVADTKNIASEEGQQTSVREIEDVTLLFYCECANENCHERIALTPREYTEQHRNKSQFVLLAGHHKPEVERIVFDGGKYIAVQKFVKPPDSSKSLNKTS